LTSLIKLPIKFIGTGEKIGSLDIFHPDRMADRILGLGDIMTLVEKANDVIDQDKAKKSMTRLLSGKMDLEDLLSQMEQMNKLGSLGSIAKMIPGLEGKISDSQFEEAEARMRI
jgi:signal recognition particle subunit SRP54